MQQQQGCVLMQVTSHDSDKGSNGSKCSTNEAPNYVCCQQQLQHWQQQWQGSNEMQSQ